MARWAALSSPDPVSSRRGPYPSACPRRDHPQRTPGKRATRTRLRSPRIFYGWWIVAAGGSVHAYTSAVFWQGFGAFFDPIIDQFGWSRGATAGVLSLHRTESGLISPFVGVLLNRFGPRRLMLFGVLLTGFAFVLMSRVDSLWQFYASVVLLTIGMSFGTFIVIVATVGNWFSRLRSRSMAVLMSASALGGMAVPIVVLLIDSQGWRDALLYVGIGFWCVGFPVAFAMRWRPEDYGQLPDGATASSASEAGAGRGARSPRELDIGVRQALRTRLFWQMTLAVSLAHMAMSASLLHIPALVSFDITRQTAGFTVLGVSAASFAGRLSVGFLGDFVDKRLLIAGAFASMVVGIGVLTSVNGGFLNLSPGVALPLFSVTYGFGFGGSIPVRLAMLPDYFGRRSFGSILGILSTFSALFGAAGPLFVGMVFDATENYRTPFLVLCLLLAAAVPLILTLQSPARFAASMRLQRARANRPELYG